MEEKLKHSIVYDESTSEIKDDIVQLCSSFKTNTGPLKRQEAAFLLWYHALSGEEKAKELVCQNIVSICLTLMDSHDSSPVDKSTAAGVLAACCQPAENREIIIKSKGATGNAVSILHSTLENGGDLSLLYASSMLRLIAEDAAGKAAFLKIIDNKLTRGSLYCRLLLETKDQTTASNICAFIRALLHHRDDLQVQAIETWRSSGPINLDIVKTLLHVVQSHKAEQTVASALGVLMELSQNRESWDRIVKCDGLRVIVDVLGPPPQAVTKKEMELWKHLIEAATTKRLQRTDGGKVGLEEDGKSPISLLSEKSKTKLTGPASESKSDTPEPEIKNLLSINSSGLKWGTSITLPTISAAAGCLYELSRNNDYMHYISRRLAAARLCPLIQVILQADGDAKKKKGGKKKGMALSDEQLEALTNVTGCLKFLTMVNTNRYRVAQLGATKILKQIYEECGQSPLSLSLRRNAQSILSNIAMLKENGKVLLDFKLPSEFLVAVPLKLSEDEASQLNIEFERLLITKDE